MVLCLLVTFFAFVAVDSRKTYVSWFSLKSPSLNPRVRQSGGGVLFSRSESIKQGGKNSTKERYVELQRSEDSGDSVIDSSHGFSIFLAPVAAPSPAPMPVSCLSLHISYRVIVHCP
jgi:hypothetical protein